MTESRSDQTRRDFLRDTTLGGVGLALHALSGSPLLAAAAAADATPDTPGQPAEVALTWLGEAPPPTPIGVSLGVPWPRGQMPRGTPLAVRNAAGQSVPSQTWPLAYWPDGSLKWSGVAVAADPTLAAPLTVAAGAPTAPPVPVSLRQDADVVEVSTGKLVCRIARHGENLVESLVVAGREVGRAGRLVVEREDRSRYASEGISRREDFTSRIRAVTVEQSGPVRAVVRVEGVHAGGLPAREWLPFTVRLYFTAGLDAIRLVHSFVFDGDAQTDFIRGLGLAFTVPFREERQNRHVRFAADGEGVWAEPVLMSPGYRAVKVKDAQQMNDDQLLGRRIPNLDALGPVTKAQFETVVVWDAFRLNQLAPDSFSIDKRTNADSSWLHVLNGDRARGLAFLGDVSGGLAAGVTHFWEKYPAAFEITGAATDAGQFKIWLWSPDASAMDLRHYDTIGHDGGISYEDHQEGFSTPNGVANTHELTLWALAETPSNPLVAKLAAAASEPPLLVCAPAHYHATRTLGVWSLPDRSTPEHAAVEEQLDRAWRFYQGEVERRKWYGFWDFGDVMRTHSPTRHGWLYDIGGHAWNETELMPNAWLWFSFLRTGDAGIFRLAEAMTRNTGEVDVYHSGRFKGLGSRHNVSHWGCGAKEARISEAWLKRFYYYLTTDERTGDLMREVLDVDRTIAEIQPLRHELTRADVPTIFRIGPDWLALASNWMTEWERTGDTRYRDQVLTGMRDIGAMPDAFVTRAAYRYDLETKHLSDMGEPNQKAGEFLVLFGGDQIAMELIELIDCPEFARAWQRLCAHWARDPKWKGYTKMRLAAYTADVDHDAALRDSAWRLAVDSLKVDGQERFPASPPILTGPLVAEPVEELPHLDTPGVSQWAINVLTTMELTREFRERGEG